MCVCGFEEGAARGQRGQRPTGLRDPEALHLDHFLSPEGFLAATSLVKFYNLLKRKKPPPVAGLCASLTVASCSSRTQKAEKAIREKREVKVTRGFVSGKLALLAK